MIGTEMVDIQANYATIYKIAYCIGTLGTLLFDEARSSPKAARERLLDQGISEVELEGLATCLLNVLIESSKAQAEKDTNESI